MVDFLRCQIEAILLHIVGYVFFNRIKFVQYFFVRLV